MFNKLIHRYFNHKLQKPLNCEYVVITFVRLQGNWYADVPYWEGSIDSLQMVGGADDLLDDLSENGHSVTLAITLNPSSEYTHRADLIKSDSFGGTYKLDRTFYNWEGSGMDEFWLCNVTKFVFGNHPRTFYFKIVNE